MRNNLPPITYHRKQNQEDQFGFKKTIYHPQYRALRDVLTPSRKMRNYKTGDLWYVAALALFLSAF